MRHAFVRTGALAAALAVGAATMAAAQEQWALGTSSVGSAPYRWGATIAEIVNAAQDQVEIHPQGTAGFNENVYLVSDGTLPLAFSDPISSGSAYRGEPPFDQGDEGLINLRWVTGAIIGIGHCFVRADSDIESLEDITGNDWNLNVQSTATRTINDHLVAAAGVEPSDFDAHELATGDVFGAMQNRIVAGSCNLLSMGDSQLQSLAATTDFRLLPIEGEIYDRFNERVGGNAVKITIPAGTYPDQEEDVATFGWITPIITAESTDEELVYAFAEAFWGSLDELRNEGAFASLEMTPEMVFGGGVVPVHAGAQRYYDDLVARGELTER